MTMIGRLRRRSGDLFLLSAICSNASNIANLRDEQPGTKANRKENVGETLLPTHRAVVYQPCQVEATSLSAVLFRPILIPRRQLAQLAPGRRFNIQLFHQSRSFRIGKAQEISVSLLPRTRRSF